MVELGKFTQIEDALERIADHVDVDPTLLRTGEIHDLRADASFARLELNWQPETDFADLARMMLYADMAALGLDFGRTTLTQQ